MLRLALSDLRHSWRVWLGAGVLLVVTQLVSGWFGAIFLFAVTNVQWARVTTALGSSGAPDLSALVPVGLASATMTTGVILSVVMITSIRSVTTLVVQQRRRLIALWQLSGMTDRQLGRMLTRQVLVLGIGCTLAAALLSAATINGVLDYIGENGLALESMTRSWVAAGICLGLGLGLGLVALAVHAAGREIRRVNALDALRSVAIRDQQMTVFRWITASLLLAAAGALAWQIVTDVPKDISNVVQGALLLMLLLVVAISALGPLVIMGTMRAWTAIVPARSAPSWFLARRTLLGTTTRTLTSTLPIAIAVILIVGLFSLTDSITAARERTEGAVSAELSLFTVISLVGLPLIVSVVAAAVMVFMAGQQRDRELALSSLAGATPAQQVLQATHEAIIVFVNGLIVGMACVLVGVWAVQPSFTAVTGGASFVVSWIPLLIVSAVVLLLNLVATLVPTVISLSRNSARVIVS